jgi:hypothetical protein
MGTFIGADLDIDSARIPLTTNVPVGLVQGEPERTHGVRYGLSKQVSYEHLEFC